VHNIIICHNTNITKSDANCASNNDVTRVHLVMSVYTSDWREIIKYYLAIKMSLNAGIFIKIGIYLFHNNHSIFWWEICVWSV